jgi:acyl carrier protein
VAVIQVSGGAVWTEQAIEGLVIDLLAALLNQQSAGLRQELVGKGADMPIDSLDLFDVLAEFRQRTGITIPKRKLRRETMRSVTKFAKFVAEEGRK